MRAREARRIEVEVAKKARIRHKRFIMSWTIIMPGRVYLNKSTTEPVCTIINYRKPPFFYIPTEVQLEGTIHFSDDIQMIEILCFLQLINIHIDNEFNAS